MLRYSEKDKVFSRIKTLLLTDDFAKKLKQWSSNGGKIYKNNPELIRLVSEYTGIDEPVLRTVWDRVYKKIILKIHYGKAKIRKRGGAGSISLNTAANTIYYAIYEKYEDEAPGIVYSVLEPFIVKALQNPGDKKAVSTARLLFVPITSENMLSVLDALKNVLSSNKTLFCDPVVSSTLRILCSQSSDLPSLKTVRGPARAADIVDSGKCLGILEKIVSEVCRDA